MKNKAQIDYHRKASANLRKKKKLKPNKLPPLKKSNRFVHPETL
jgi:hypothetical protein